FLPESGSGAVRIAPKMAVQFWRNRGRRARTRLVAFRGAYHGDTTGAMALSDPQGDMHAAFRGVLPEHVVADLPLDDASMASFEALLESEPENIARIIRGPPAQCHGGKAL